MIRNYLGKNVLKIYSLISLSLLLVGLIFLLCFLFFYNQKNTQEETRFHSSNPRELSFFETAFSFSKGNIDLNNKEVVAGIIPHHLLAADLIAEEFYNLQNKDYDTIILLGPNHFDSGDADVISSTYDWETPYGVLECDKETLMFLGEVGIEDGILSNEHSVSSEVAFIKKTFPRAKFLPIILKSSVTSTQAEVLANDIFLLSQNKNILVLGSIDFSHYKDSETAQKNDQMSIAAINNFDFDSIYNLDIDSPASLYALLKYSRLRKAEFILLNNSNSAILAGKPDIQNTTSYVTGYFAKNNITEKDDSLRMLFFGDMMLDRHVGELIDKNGLNYIFEKLEAENFFDDYDLISANLEGTVTDEGRHYSPVKAYDFAFAPELVAELKNYNFNFFNLANNHFDDQGERGVSETFDNLDKLNFYYSGCDGGKIGECAIRTMEIKNKKIGMVGLSVFGRPFDIFKAKEEIKNLKKELDLIIVNIHWGNEYETQFNSTQKNIGNELVDAGADLIIGHHPHVTQGMEVYQGKYIFYSLGNFIFDQYFSDETQKSLAIEAVYNNSEFSFTLHPLKSEKGQINFIEGEEKQKWLNEIIDNRSKLNSKQKNDLIK